MNITNHDQNGHVDVRFSEDLITILERNDSRLNLTSISNENFLKIIYTTFYTGIKDYYDNNYDESYSSIQIPILPKLESFQFLEFTNKGFKMKLNY